MTETKQKRDFSDLTIRKATLEDWKSIQGLNLQIFEFELETCEPTSNLEYPFSEEGIEYFKKAASNEDGYSAIVADLSGQVVAYAILKEIPESELTHRIGVKQIQLHTLSVDKRHRDRGLGKQVLNQAIEIAKEKGANRLKVVAYAPNERARHLYRSSGFSELEVVHELNLS